MRPIFLFLLVAGVGIVALMVVSRPTEKKPEVRQEAIAVSKHSKNFNDAVASVLSAYNQLAENFVTWDSSAAMYNASVCWITSTNFHSMN